MSVKLATALGKRAGVVINPATAAAVLEDILQEVEQVLVMTVNSGFGHQQFLPMTLPKTRRVRQMIDRIKETCEVEVDGGHRCRYRSVGGCGRSRRSRSWNGNFWRARSNRRCHAPTAGEPGAVGEQPHSV